MAIDLKNISDTPLQAGDRVVIVRDSTSMQLVDPGTFATKDLPTSTTPPLEGDAVVILRSGNPLSIPYVENEPRVEALEVASAARDLAITDDRKVLRFTHATPVLTIRTQADIAYAADFAINGSMLNGGTITASTGVTLNGVSAGSFTVGTEADGIMFWLRKIADDTWLASSGGGGGGGGGDMTGAEIVDAVEADATITDAEKRAFLVYLKGVAIAASSSAQSTGAVPIATATTGEVQWSAPVTFAPATGAELIAGTSNIVIVTPASFGSALGLHPGTVASGAMDIDLAANGFLNWSGTISANTDIQFDEMPSTWAGRTVTVLLTNDSANARTLTVSDTAAVNVTIGNDVPALTTPAQIGATSLLVFYVASANHMVLTAAVHSPAP